MGRTRSIDSDLQPIPTLERLYGAELAGRFHDAFAGKEMSVPKYPTPLHPIAIVIGIEAAKALGWECGGCRFSIPSNRNRRVSALHAEGKTKSEIAAEVSITARSVRRIITRLGLIRTPNSKSDTENTQS